MEDTTEGVILTCSETSSSQYPEQMAQHLPEVNADLNSLPKITRQLFVADIQKAIGDLNSQTLPMGIKPVLSALSQASKQYLNHGDEQLFMSQCLDVIENCSQGWSYFSYWISTEQSTCYSIYWGLRAAVEKHQKQMTMYLGSKNDGLPKNDSDPPFSPDPKVSSIQEWITKNGNKEVSSKNPSFLQETLSKVLGGRAKNAQECLMQQYTSKGLEAFDHFGLVQQNINQIIENKQEA